MQLKKFFVSNINLRKVATDDEDEDLSEDILRNVRLFTHLPDKKSEHRFDWNGAPIVVNLMTNMS